MLNPISKHRSYFLSFIMVWAVIFGIHTIIINLFYDIPGIISLTDSAVFNLFFAVIGYNLWFVVRFNLREKQKSFDLIISHLITAIVIIAIWLFSSYFLLKNMYVENDSYVQFLNESLPWRVITGIFFYLFFIMFYYVMLYYEDLQEKLIIEAELKNLVQEAELTALKSQINPHFLFNSLNSISSLTITNPDDAQEMVIKLSDFLRYSLSHDKNEKTSLEDEIDNLKRYLDIEKVRFGKRLNFVHNISKDYLKVEIPNMILQPLIENSIKHGVYNSSEEVLVTLKCEVKDDLVRLEISNDYDPKATKKKGHGIGLSNIKKRLQLIYKRQDLLEIKADKLTFTALLSFPFEK